MDPATINAGTSELRAEAKPPIAASVTYGGPSQTATLTPDVALATVTTQFRVYFKVDDGDNNCIGYYAADNGTVASRPQLVIDYLPPPGS